MIYFCIRLKQPSPLCLYEIFYNLTPQLQQRGALLLFGDLSKVLNLHGSLEVIDTKIQKILELYQLEATWAIDSSIFWAQVKSLRLPIPLEQYPLWTLIELEGLRTWSSKALVQEALDFLSDVGLNTWTDILPISLQDLSERLGPVGDLLYRRIHRMEKEEGIALYHPPQGYLDHTLYCEIAIAHPEWLTEKVELIFAQLYERVQKLNKIVNRLSLSWSFDFCEKIDRYEIPITTPHSTPLLWLKLFKSLKVSIPSAQRIQEITVRAYLKPIEHQALSLFESPSLENQEKFLHFRNWLQTQNVNCGFLQTRTHPFWEERSQMQSEAPLQESSLAEENFAALAPIYSHPSPRPLNIQELAYYQIHSYFQERIDVLNPGRYRRHYFLAKNRNQQWQWIFFDPETQHFFWHGTFD